MLPEFLSYRYEGLKRPDQILLHRENVGWKCRKYTRWRQVHNTPDDGKILWTFANDLLENGKVNLTLYGQINLILLNVQKWRLDKENLSVEPPSNEAWEYVKTLLQVVARSPQVIVQWLLERSIEIPESTVEIQITFYLHLLDVFFSRQKIDFYSPLSENEVTLQNSAKLTQTVRKHFGPIYKSVGLDFPANLKPPALIERIYEDFGFDAVCIETRLNIDKLPLKAVKRQVFVDYKTLERTKLFKIHSIHDNVFLELNDRHPFIQEVLKDNKARELFEAFFRSYAISVTEMTGLIDTITTFSSYLENHLAQEFSSIKK